MTATRSRRPARPFVRKHTQGSPAATLSDAVPAPDAMSGPFTADGHQGADNDRHSFLECGCLLVIDGADGWTRESTDTCSLPEDQHVLPAGTAPLPVKGRGGW